MWFSVPLVTAESLMFFSSILMIINFWSTKVLPVTAPIHYVSEMDKSVTFNDDRPISIDLFITSYNEDLAVVEDTIIDAKRINYPYREVKLNIHLCDDGCRDGRDLNKDNFKKLTRKYNINYFVREDNKGFKAGNLNNAFWQTDGDLIVILDADTRLFPNFLVNLTGYFRDEKMAWVQSPQWFYDIPEGISLKDKLIRLIGKPGRLISKFIPYSDKIRFGKDLYGTDPQIFYDSILRHRNSSNAAFCCGAGSIHRRKALEQLILNKTKRLQELNSHLKINPEKIKKKNLLPDNKTGMIVGPFVHHISEDIYTSVLQHSDKNKWKSYQHPNVECKMLSPQTLHSYTKQYSRYAEGTYDLFFSKENPLFKRGLSIRQRLAYMETIYSYFSPLWILIFLLSPIVFFFTLTPPIKAFNFDFFIRFLTFIFLNLFISTIGNWGISTKRSEQYYIAGIWIKLRALIKIIFRRTLQFNPTTKSIAQESLTKNIKLILPHLIIMFLTFIGFVYNLYLSYKNLHPSYSSFFANSLWSFYNMYQINPIIRAALKK